MLRNMLTVATIHIYAISYIFSHFINFVSNPINTFGKMVLNETNVDKIVVYMCGIRGTNH